MPGLKRSVTRRVKYGGDRSAEMELREAIDFLFQLRGVEYQKLHPEFVIPTSEEFFTYARQANVLAEKTRVKPTGTSRNKFASKVKTTNRKLPMTVLAHGGGNLDAFFRFILPFVVLGKTPCDTLFKCINILLYAIMVYKFTTLFITQQQLNPEFSVGQFIANIKTVSADRSYANSFADPIRWFCENVMPSLNDSRDTMMEIVGSLIPRCMEFILGLVGSGEMVEGFRSSAAGYVGTAITTGLNLFFVTPLTFDSLVALPLSCGLARLGFAGCGEKCVKLMADVSRRMGLGTTKK